MRFLCKKHLVKPKLACWNVNNVLSRYSWVIGTCHYLYACSVGNIERHLVSRYIRPLQRWVRLQDLQSDQFPILQAEAKCGILPENEHNFKWAFCMRGLNSFYGENAVYCMSLELSCHWICSVLGWMYRSATRLIEFDLVLYRFIKPWWPSHKLSTGVIMKEFFWQYAKYFSTITTLSFQSKSEFSSNFFTVLCCLTRLLQLSGGLYCTAQIKRPSSLLLLIFLFSCSTINLDSSSTQRCTMKAGSPDSMALIIHIGKFTCFAIKFPM